ncbi:hypothetical protein [Pseudomonas azerbaijanoccidentalis]
MQHKVSNDRTLSITTLPTGGFYAQLDKFVAIQDYLPQQECVRLFGVSVQDFENENFLNDGGCQTYVIDIGVADFLKAIHNHGGWDSDLTKNGNFINRFDDFWIFINFNSVLNQTSSYAYAAFTESGPQYIEVSAIKLLNKKIQLPPLESDSPLVKPSAGDVAKLSSFHVGQGMCSVYTYAEQQFLVDAGAGKPVTREVYLRNRHQDGSQFQNDLRACLNKKHLTAIISHLDSDHWRLLEWDSSICAKTTNIFFPIGTTSLALRSSAIAKKVKALDSCTLAFDSHNYLAVFRTKPSRSDKNGEGVVVVAVCDGQPALLPGDYVYERMLSDHDADLRVLASQHYAAVVVPHHGDRASARDVPPAIFWGMQRRPIAFFSAGTHARNRHPRPGSVAAHISSGFDVIVNNKCPNIVERRLL